MPHHLTQRADAFVMALSGHFLGSVERLAIEPLIADVARTPCARLVVDLSGVSFVDTPGLGLLVQAAKTLRAHAGDVCVAGMDERVESLFLEMRLLGTVFDGYASVEAALQHFTREAEAPSTRDK